MADSSAVSVPTIGEIVRKSEHEYVNGTTKISKYVDFSQYDTIQQIGAYLNSVHISGETDELGRDKPFYNISVAAANVWQRATDIDRSNIKIRATNASGWLDSFVATVLLREWMRRARFGVYLNDWGRTLARYGSAVTKVVRSEGQLHINKVSWDNLICDPVDFNANPKIEVIELTQAELRRRVTTNGYDSAKVDALIDSLTTRRTLDRQTKDTKSDYIRLYEVHGNLSKWLLTHEDSDIPRYVQQMHVISFVEKKTGSRKKEYEDFTLVQAEEPRDPYRITHLIEEDGRSLSIGAVEHLFQAQWMVNHSKKMVKDTLDIASLLLFQTAEGSMVGKNVLTDMVTGGILVKGKDDPNGLTQINTAKPDIVGFENYASSWKMLGNEITGVSEAMLGAAPKSGTAWRTTEALLNESHSLFELMQENKGLALEDLLREEILPFIRETMLDNPDEISAILEQHEIHQIDSAWIKSKSLREAGRRQIVDKLLKDEMPTQEAYDQDVNNTRNQLQDTLKNLGNKRFFKPSEVSEKTWKEQFKDLEWEVEVDITGEQRNIQEAMTTLDTALKVIVTPGFAENEQAKAVVGKILELSGSMSPVEYGAIPSPVRVPAPDTPGMKGPALPAEPT